MTINNVMAIFSAFFSGGLFAFGLGYSRMTDSDKLWNFLDFFGGRWDPSLGFVMMGGIGVYTVLYFIKGQAPVFSKSFSLPSSSRIDRRLLSGAALFGVGWGIAGLCPGPAIASIATGRSSILVFMAFLVVGNFIYKFFHLRN